MIKIKKLEKSEVEIEGSVPFSELEKFRGRAMEDLSKEIKMDGFRKGHIPEKILVSKIGIFPILEKMSNLAMNSMYPKIISENKIEVIGMPKIQITKLAEGNPMEYKIRTAIMPNIKICDYKKEASSIKQKEVPNIKKEDIEKVILEMRKQKGFEKLNSEEKKVENPKVEDHMPSEDDEFAKKMGDYKSLSELKEKIREGLIRESELKEKNRRRVEILEKIVNKSTIDVPNVLIENELEIMMHEFEANIGRMSLSIDVYLKQIKKTIDELKKDWKDDAKKRVKFNLILKDIAEKEKIVSDEKEIEKEVGDILKIYNDADPNRVRSYVKGQIINEKVYTLLEN